MEQQTAFIGDRRELVKELAAELRAALQMQPIEPALKVSQAAKLLNVSTDQVRELAERGLIPAFDISLPGSNVRNWRFWKHELARLGDIKEKAK